MQLDFKVEETTLTEVQVDYVRQSFLGSERAYQSKDFNKLINILAQLKNHDVYEQLPVDIRVSVGGLWSLVLHKKTEINRKIWCV